MMRAPYFTDPSFKSFKCLNYGHFYSKKYTKMTLLTLLELKSVLFSWLLLPHGSTWCAATSRRGGSPSMDVAITPQSTTKGIFIDFNSTCFHACLTDGTMCEKCKNFMSHSFPTLCCSSTTIVRDYSDVKKVRAFGKMRCESILEFFDKNDITVSQMIKRCQ
jgi:hypothetical protein